MLFNGFAFMEGIHDSTKSPCLLVGCSMQVCQYSEVVSHTSQAGENLQRNVSSDQKQKETNGKVQRPPLRSIPTDRERVSQGQCDTYLGKRRYDQVIAMSDEKERKTFKMHLNDKCDL